MGNVSDEEAYRTWNMGQGMLIISPKPDDVVKIASSHGIESKPVGRIRHGIEIEIKNKGIFKERDMYIKF